MKLLSVLPEGARRRGGGARPRLVSLRVSPSAAGCGELHFPQSSAPSRAAPAHSTLGARGAPADEHYLAPRQLLKC